jgi:acyl transferase domain-containing protein
LSQPFTEPIAIVGIGARFPAASDTRAFWALLREGQDAVRDVPHDRWGAIAPGERSGEDALARARGGFLDRVDGFDWRTFRISPREAKFMDPQQRLALELAWETLEDAGVPFEDVAGSSTGVYLALMWNDYLQLQARAPDELTGYSATGNVFAFAPARVSHFFDLRGPSIAVDGACAASLASVHAACQSLRLGECSMALAGGINLMVSPTAELMLSDLGVLSRAGRCRTLDASADGFVRGEGGGMILLKPASRLTPNDRAYAYIRGSAMGHNGRNEWLIAASSRGQQAVLREAYRIAGVDPACVDYVELHGTALRRGDEIEVAALAAVLGDAPGRQHPCRIGSVKSNIGHLESAGGIAGLIKVALSLHNKHIPPTLHLENPQPSLLIEGTKLAPQRELEPWPQTGQPALAGVTAVSMTGLNAHVVVQQAEPRAGRRPDAPERQRLFVLSAPRPNGLAALVQCHIDFFSRTDVSLSLRDVAYTLGAGRTHHDCRVAVIAARPSSLVDGLRDALNRLSSGEGVLPITPEANCDPVLVDAASDYLAGRAIPWSSLVETGVVCADLPARPWQRQRLWLDATGAAATSANPARDVALPEEVERIRPVLERAHAQDRSRLLERWLQAQLAEVLGFEPTEVPDLDKGFFDVGLSSLTALQFMERLSRGLGLELPVTLLFTCSNLSGLARHTLPLLFPDPRTATMSVVRTDDGRLRRVEELSEEEALEELLRKV